MMLESSAADATNRLSDSGVTVCSTCQSPLVTTPGMRTTNRIRIDRKDVLVKRRIDSNHVPHLMINFEFQRGHGRIEMHAVEVVHEQNLTVSFAAIARLGPLRGLAHFDDNHITATHIDVNTHTYAPTKMQYLRNDVPLELVQPRVDLAIIDLFRTLANRPEHQRLGVNLGVDTHYIQHDPRRSPVVPASNDIAVTDDEE